MAVFKIINKLFVWISKKKQGFTLISLFGGGGGVVVYLK